MMKIKVIYETDQEKEKLVQMLSPILRGARFRRDKKGEKPHKTLYITLKNQI